jgi:hypothetical protein
VFRDLPSSGPDAQPESFLLDIRSAGEYVFAPYRVDVAADGTILGVWETFRGNPWDNRGAVKYIVDVAAKEQVDVVVEAKVVARKAFYEERAKCKVYIYPSIDLARRTPLNYANILFNRSFALESCQEPYDLARNCCNGPYVWNAQAHGKQYVHKLFPLSMIQ